MAFALQCLDRNRPIRSRGHLGLHAYRGEAPSAVRLGSVSDSAGTTPQCGADGQQSVVPASTQRDNLFVNYIALQPKHSKCAEAFG